MARNKIFLLDAMALLYRAHFAFIKNPRITSKGLNTSAVFGFTNTLLEIISKEKPSHIAVAFDTSEPTFRHKQFEAYKANREEQPEDLRIAIPYAIKLLEVLQIPALSLHGYEADDIIGTIASKLDPDTCDVYMVTPDKDYAQLVTDNVFLFKPKYRGGGFDVQKPDDIEASFGIPPSQIADFLGLKGDSVDNIPGIPKIGDKTAVSLLKEFGSLENIVENAESITKKSIRESVKEFGEQGKMSKELATIMLDVPLEWTMEDLKMGHADLEALVELMGELEFKTTAQRILNSTFNPLQTSPQTDLFGNPTGDQDMDLIDFGNRKNIESEEHQYHLIDTKEARADLIKKIQEQGSFCWDTETTSLDAMNAELVGLAVSLKPGEAYYIPFPEDFDKAKALIEEFVPVLCSGDIVKIGQNLKYDSLVLYQYGIIVSAPMFDTMLAHYVVQADGKHGMDAMARELLNYDPVSIETLIGKKGKKQLSMRDVPVEKVVEYAGEDADITLQIYNKLSPKVADDFIFNKIEQPLMPVLTDMEYQGVRVDEKTLNEYSEDLTQRLKSLEKDIYELAGEKFNINSPRQLGDILFEKLGLGKGTKAKKTKTGQYATSEQILIDLANKHELPERVLAYRGIKKLQSTYVDALPQLINPKTGRVHTTFSQSVAVTGRLSSINPNLQNIPIRTQDGREVRKGFIPRSEEYTLLSADYSQVELRIMAALSQDSNMLEAFRTGLDIHRATASRVFGVEPDEVTSDQRSAAKTVNFGIIYGISAFGLSQRMNISRSEAQDIIKTYFDKYSQVKEYMDQSIETAKTKGYAETYFGRRRSLQDINSRNATVRGFAERNAINSPIQGTAADIIKLAMINIYDTFQKENLASKMILQVHDELVFDVHQDEIEVVKEIVYGKMKNAADLGVPLEVEMGTGKHWLEAH